MDSANKRIAKNTIYIYIRLFTTMVIGLYTSRLVLEILGVSDFGLFSVVGGVLAMFTFISTALTGSTSRFLNAEMGKKGGDLNAMFNINLALHIALALIILVLAETIGLWYVCNKLNVAEGKMDDAIFVFHVSILTSCLGIINSPYQSLFRAFERFKFIATLDIVNSIVRFGCILMLSLIPHEEQFTFLNFHFSNLRVYSIIFALTTVNTFVIFHWIAYRDWSNIIRRRFVYGWNRYKEVLSFGGWDTLATLAFMARSSGSDLILNTFFGTAVNGACSIGRTVSQITTNMSGNVDAASTPQIIQAYAAGDKVRYTYLANKIGKVTVLVYELLFFPIIIQIDFILQLWLGKVPDGAADFTFWTLLLAGMNISTGGIYSITEASAKIKWFRISFSAFVLLGLPVGWFILSIGLPAYSIFVVFVVVEIINRIIMLIMLKRILEFDSIGYVREAYFRPAIIGVIMSFVILLGHQLNITSTWGSIVLIISCFLLTIGLIFSIGMSRAERSMVYQKMQMRFHLT